MIGNSTISAKDCAGPAMWRIVKRICGTYVVQTQSPGEVNWYSVNSFSTYEVARDFFENQINAEVLDVYVPEPPCSPSTVAMSANLSSKGYR